MAPTLAPDTLSKVATQPVTRCSRAVVGMGLQGTTMGRDFFLYRYTTYHPLSRMRMSTTLEAYHASNGAERK